MNQLEKFLDDHSACSEARKWAQEHKTLRQAWSKCRDAAWMLWAINVVGYADERVLRLFGCWCVRNTPLADGRKVWDLLTDTRSVAAVEAAVGLAIFVMIFRLHGTVNADDASLLKG